MKGSEAKNKGHTNFYECCDLTKKYIYSTYIISFYSYISNKLRHITLKMYIEMQKIL